MMEYFPVVNILHSGGDKELGLINHLENGIVIESAKDEVPCFTLNYTIFQPHQDKKEIIFNNAKTYKEGDNPLIVFISENLFEKIWTSVRKAELVKSVTSEELKGCVHVWLDVKEEDVKFRSHKLCCPTNKFRIVEGDELLKTDTSGVITKLRSLIQSTMINKIAEEQENLSIDDEEDEMKNNFLRQNPQYSDIMAEEQNEMEVETCEPNKKKKKGKKKSRSVYSDALMIASMSGEELEEYRRANTGETSTTTADTTGSTETDH